MKSRCEGCKNFKNIKQMPDYQVTFHNWCELFQTPSGLIKASACDYSAEKLKDVPVPKIERQLNEFFNIFWKRQTPSSPPFVE
jgi:hypothetical protein